MATGAKQAILKEAIESGNPVELDLRVPSHPGLNGWYVSPILVENGQPAGALGYSRAPRTVIGADADGKIYLICVDGSELDLVQAGGPVGATENELVAIAQFLGLVNAANLDGGGRSTSMVVEGKVLSHDVKRHLQSPYDDDRRVGDAVLIIDDKP
ncbi:phosphodiester glycosidase family protein [Cephaloticoccus primus]|uniref:phosphodiester glycosidase family protein n=1 Tax=Cephaloticoccus primus TaxID=1548207 RepID=UPI0018D29044|nr:phosphodiester glycosidase family protein [Cephaloticoccus primus]